MEPPTSLIQQIVLLCLKDSEVYMGMILKSFLARGQDQGILSGNLYFAENNTNKIGRLVLSTNTFTEWSIGNNPLTNFTDSSGNFYFIGGRGVIGRLG